jgi:tight adherence protein B
MDPMLLLAMVLAAGAAAAIYFAVIDPLITGDAQAEKRQRMIAGTAGIERKNERGVSVAMRKDQVAQTLKELEKKEKDRNHISLESRIQQGGLQITKQQFFLYSAIFGVVVAAGTFLGTMNVLIAVLVGFVAALGLPRWFLNYRRNKRIKTFTNELPNAIDVIVRGIRSGLPLGDCIRIIASETKEPVKSEFRQIVEAQAMGISTGDAVQKLYERMPVPEVNFFAIVIGIQQKSGGNLSETLSNLSKVLRDRKKLQGKIQAMSMEAKASASIIGCLPPAVALIVYMTSPKYMELLWLTQAGKIAIAGGLTWMLMGILTMRKMINFDY